MAAQSINQITGIQNFSDKWIVSADCLQISNIHDNNNSDHHIAAMNLVRIKESQLEFASIAKNLHTLPEHEDKREAKKFNIVYFIATEHMASASTLRYAHLETHHGVNICPTYRNVNSCKEFVHFLSKSKKEELASLSSKA